MRALGFGLVLLGSVLALSFGCGESTRAAVANAGSSGAATAGSGSSSAGTAAGKAGATTTAGATSGGTSSGGNGSGGTVTGGGVSGGTATTGGQPEAGAGNEAGSSAALVDCDPKKILCKRLAPECGAGEVPSVDASCYGDCVKISRCRCAAAAECPEPEQYTCWARQHCGPFVQ